VTPLRWVIVPVTVRIPEFLRDVTRSEAEVIGEGASVEELIADLEARFPGLAARMVDDSGLRRYVNLFVNGEEVRFLSGLQTPVRSEDSVVILPAMAGG
jgi:molybdopterin synthase sulfur carrier subunit